jgi:hypothetical protein
VTAHDCKVLTKGCYRCDLNLDEIESYRQELHAEAQVVLARVELADRPATEDEFSTLAEAYRDLASR